MHTHAQTHTRTRANTRTHINTKNKKRGKTEGVRGEEEAVHLHGDGRV